MLEYLIQNNPDITPEALLNEALEQGGSYILEDCEEALMHYREAQEQLWENEQTQAQDRRMMGRLRY